LADLQKKTALLAGATGLVGGHVLRRLLAHPSYLRVEVLVRRELPIRDPKVVQRVVDFEDLGAGMPGTAADEVFCCIGTTIREAGSQDAFRRVDHDYPLALARLGKAAGARQFLLVSALGADAQSSIFYSRVKARPSRILLQSACRRSYSCGRRSFSVSVARNGQEKGLAFSPAS
jgi:uncharacterized protein YbjT (DUF2867 family)